MSLTSLLQGDTYNEHTLLQGLISYIKQVTAHLSVAGRSQLYCKE